MESFARNHNSVNAMPHDKLILQLIQLRRWQPLDRLSLPRPMSGSSPNAEPNDPGRQLGESR
jgi:hypothetical protein